MGQDGHADRFGSTLLKRTGRLHWRVGGPHPRLALEEEYNCE